MDSILKKQSSSPQLAEEGSEIPKESKDKVINENTIKKYGEIIAFQLKKEQNKKIEAEGCPLVLKEVRDTNNLKNHFEPFFQRFKIPVSAQEVVNAIHQTEEGQVRKFLKCLN